MNQNVSNIYTGPVSNYFIALSLRFHEAMVIVVTKSANFSFLWKLSSLRNSIRKIFSIWFIKTFIKNLYVVLSATKKLVENQNHLIWVTHDMYFQVFLISLISEMFLFSLEKWNLHTEFPRSEKFHFFEKYFKIKIFFELF